MAVVNPFNRLLNSISHDLNQHNLRSLLQICRQYIPECRREEIKDGFDLFRFLVQNNVIGDDHQQACNLLEIVRSMKPRRKDIVRQVKNFIRKNYDPPLGFEDSESSFVFQPSAVLVEEQPTRTIQGYESGGGDSASHLYPSNSLSFSGQQIVEAPNNHCTIDCCCFECRCYSRTVPTCVLLVATVVFALLTILTAMCWFEKIPEKLFNKMGKSGIASGKYVVACLGFTTVVFFVWVICRKISTSRRRLSSNRLLDSSSREVLGGLVSPGEPTKYYQTVAIPHSGSVNSVARSYWKTRRNSNSSAPPGSVTAGSSYTTIPGSTRRHGEPKVMSKQLSYPESSLEDGLQTDGMFGSDNTGGDLSDTPSHKACFSKDSTDSEAMLTKD